jgi:hypothetical protein
MGRRKNACERLHKGTQVVLANGILPSLLYADLTKGKWRFAIGQQMDVFAECIPNMVDIFFALAISGYLGNSSRGQIRAERFLAAGHGGKFTFTAALSEPITTYF